VKLTSKVIVFVMAALAISSCFEEPEFSNVPEIEFDDIYYGESEAGDDSVVLSIRFRDGDGDLGNLRYELLDGTVINDEDDPIHANNYYLSTGGSSLQEVGTITYYTDTIPPFVGPFPDEQVPMLVLSTRGRTGKLVTLKNQAGFTGNAQVPSLPAFDRDFYCRDYNITALYVHESDWGILDDSYYVRGPVVTDFNNEKFKKIVDTVYYKPNPNHYTLEVKFFIDNVEYDWFEEFCTTYNGRLSRLSDTDSPLDGVIRYKMTSEFWRFIFSVRKLRLKVKLRDRALNVSNEITTPEFTLEDIKR
jgi:hypothetical protein